MGKKLLAHCERQAAAQGFSMFEMMATLTGAKLYGTQGYESSGDYEHKLSNGISFKFIRMVKKMPENINIMTPISYFFSNSGGNSKTNEQRSLDVAKDPNVVLPSEIENQIKIPQSIDQTPDQFFEKEERSEVDNNMRSC